MRAGNSGSFSFLHSGLQRQCGGVCTVLGAYSPAVPSALPLQVCPSFNCSVPGARLSGGMQPHGIALLTQGDGK